MGIALKVRMFKKKKKKKKHADILNAINLFNFIFHLSSSLSLIAYHFYLSYPQLNTPTHNEYNRLQQLSIGVSL